MIRAIVENGVIRPIDPLPADWSEGQLVRVEEAEPENGPALDAWFQELQRLGPARYEPGEAEQVQAILAEADTQAKATVRREMGLP